MRFIPFIPSRKRVNSKPLSHYSGVLSEAVQESAAAKMPASGAAALSEYLKTCEQHSIVPDVGGAFARAFAAGFSLATSQAAPAAVAVPDDAQIKALMRKHRIWIEHSTLLEDDEPPRALCAVQAEQHQFEAFVQDLIGLATMPTVAPTPNERGWICKHKKYGTWFLPWRAIVDDWKRYDAEHGKGGREPDDGTVRTWWNEQCGWIEVRAFGTQLSRPDMAAHEAAFKDAMAEDYHRPQQQEEANHA